VGAPAAHQVPLACVCVVRAHTARVGGRQSGLCFHATVDTLDPLRARRLHLRLAVNVPGPNDKWHAWPDNKLAFLPFPGATVQGGWEESVAAGKKKRGKEESSWKGAVLHSLPFAGNPATSVLPPAILERFASDIKRGGIRIVRVTRVMTW
jgi:hypothetical protein